MWEPNRRRESHRNGQKQAVSGFILTGSNAHFLSGGNTGMGVREFHFLRPDPRTNDFQAMSESLGLPSSERQNPG
jgi:hypothetical protein